MTEPPNLAAGFAKQTQFTSLQYLFFYCCINIRVFINEEQWKVILGVKVFTNFKCFNPTW